jgi:uroporphyrinogen-III synthase
MRCGRIAHAPGRLKHVIAVLNTRPREQAGRLSEALADAGYQPREAPLVELALSAEGLAALQNRAQNADAFLLTSPNLLAWFTERMDAAGKKILASKPWYAISPSAREPIESLGGRVAFTPRRASLRGMLEEFPSRPGMRLLHLCSSETRLDPADFAAIGVTVENLPVYSPRCPESAGADLQAAWPGVQAVLFASGSAVRNLFRVAPDLGRTLNSENGPKPVSIGPSATEALQENRIAHPLLAPTADNAGFIAALDAAFPKT